MSKKTALGNIMALLALVQLLALTLPARMSAADDGWEKELLQERGKKDANFKTSVTSPMAGRERLTMAAAAKTYVCIDGGAVNALEKPAPGAAFALLFRGGKWYWDEAIPGIECRLGERPVAKGSEALAPGCLFHAGRLTLAAYPGPETIALIVFDPQRRQVQEFRHLLYYPPDRRYAVPARLERFAEPQPLKVITTRQLEKTYYRFGRVHFQLEGKAMTLTALKTGLEGPEAEYLFIPFKDLSNGKETYEVGRFLDIPTPAGDELILDFNRCYNPLCNYSPAYNCPLPPLENILDAAIPAGEKTYPH